MFKSSIFAVVRVEADIPYMLHRAQTCTEALCCDTQNHIHTYIQAVRTAPGFSFVLRADVYFIAGWFLRQLCFVALIVRVPFVFEVDVRARKTNTYLS